VLIVIVGPDGSGKTTIANEIGRILRKNNVHSRHLAMNFSVLPKLRDIINPFLKKKITPSHVEGEYLGGMKDPPNSILRGMCYVTWYGIDYCLGQIKLNQWKKRGEVIIFARYFYDYYFQRAYSKVPHWYINIFEKIIPEPSFILTINRPAEDIFKLKPELSIDEIVRQQSAISKLLENKINYYVIDGSSGIENTLEQVKSILEIN
jgi:thymidylate kinase